MLSKNRFAVSLAFFICGFVYTNWTTRLPRIQDTFLLDNSTLGLILLCVAVGSLCSMPLTGWLIARRGSRFATVVSLLLFSASLAVFPYFESVVALAMGFYVVGFFTGALDVAMNTQAVAVEQKYTLPMMSSFHAIFSIGMMLGALSGAFFAKNYPSLVTHFTWVAMGCTLVSALATPFFVEDKPAPSAQSSPAFLWPDKTMLLLGLIAFCGMVAEGSMADWSTNYLRHVVQTDEATAPIGLSIFSATMTIGRLFGDKARSTFGDNRLLFVSAFLATCGLALGLSWLHYWVFCGGLFLVGLGLAVIIPIVYSQAGNNSSLPSGVGLAMVTTVGYTGFLAGPPIIGFLADWQGLRFAFGFVVFLLVVLTLLSRIKAQN
ncbi:MAG: MFS transporter [Runella sp.]